MSSASSQDEPWALHNGNHRAIVCFWADLMHSGHVRLSMNDCSFTQHVLNIHRSGYSAVVGSRSGSGSEASFMVQWKVCAAASAVAEKGLCCCVNADLVSCRACLLQHCHKLRWSEKEKKKVIYTCFAWLWSTDFSHITKLSETWVSHTPQSCLTYSSLTYQRIVWNTTNLSKMWVFHTLLSTDLPETGLSHITELSETGVFRISQNCLKQVFHTSELSEAQGSHTSQV